HEHLALPAFPTRRSSDLIGIVTGADVPPPGAGFETVTSPLPSTGTFAAESVAVSVVLLIVLVVFDEPFHSTIDSALNPVPVTIRDRKSTRLNSSHDQISY